MGRLRNGIALSLGALALSILLPGERPSDDPRFVTPAAPIHAFWRAIQLGAHGDALECFVGVGRQVGNAQVVELPPLDAIEIEKMMVTPSGEGRAIVRYQVHYRVHGGDEHAFATADEVMLVNGEWRILRPISAERHDLPTRAVPRPRPHVAPGPEYA